MIKDFSNLFSLPYLRQICENIENDEQDLNASIGTYVCDISSQQMKELFLNKKMCADIKIVWQSK